MHILENLAASQRFFCVAALNLFWFANAIWFGAYRRAKSALHRVWAFIIYAHGTVMKRIIFSLALGVSFVGVTLLFEDGCMFDESTGQYLCGTGTNWIEYNLSTRVAHIDFTSRLGMCILLFLALVVTIWDCLNATISINTWKKERRLPSYRSKPFSFHVTVVCLAFILSVFLWTVAPFKYLMILHFALAEAAFPTLKNYLNGTIFDYTSTFSAFSYFVPVTLICCTYRIYVFANYLYRIYDQNSTSQDQASADTTKQQLATLEGALVDVMQQQRDDQLKFQEVQAKLDGVQTQFEEYRDESERARADSKEELSHLKTQFEEYRVKSEEARAEMIAKSEKAHADSEKELSDVKTQFEGYQEESKKAQARCDEKLESIKSLYRHNLEALAGYNTLLTRSDTLLTDTRNALTTSNALLADTRNDLTTSNALLTDTCNALATSNDLLSNITNKIDGRQQEQRRSPCDTSNAVSDSPTRPSSDSILFRQSRRSINEDLSLVQRRGSQPESTDDSSKPTSGPHALNPNSPDVDQAGKPDPCSDPPENRNSQGTPTNATVPSHSDSPPMNSARAVSTDSGSNPELSHHTGLSETKSENTNPSNIDGNLLVQQDTNVSSNDSPEKEECKTATSDNASRNADSELPQSKVDNPTPVDSSPTHLLPTGPAKTGYPSPRKRAKFPRSAPTSASQIASPTSTTEASGSPSMANTSASHSPEIKQANRASPFTKSEPQNAPGTGSDTVPDPAHSGSPQRDEEGPESNDSGSASEPTDQESQPHLDPETKDTGSSDSGCKPSMQQNSNLDPNKHSGVEQSQDSAKDLDCVQPKAGIETDDSPPECSGSTQPPLIDEGTEFPGKPLSSSSPKTSADSGSESRSSQDIQTDEPESLHLGFPPMDDKSSNLEKSGSNPGPSNQIGQSHTGSETGSTNHEGDHPTQQDSNVNLNDSPVEEEYETNQPCDQSKTESTSDKTPLFTGNGEGEPSIPTRDSTSDSSKSPKKKVINFSRHRGYSPQRHTPLIGHDLSSSLMLQESQPRLLCDEKRPSSCEPPRAPHSSFTVSSQPNPTTSGSGFESHSSPGIRTNTAGRPHSDSLLMDSESSDSTGSHSNPELRNVPNMEHEAANAKSDCSSDNDGSEVDPGYGQSTPEDMFDRQHLPPREK